MGGFIHTNETNFNKYLSLDHQICGGHTRKELGCTMDVQAFPADIHNIDRFYQAKN